MEVGSDNNDCGKCRDSATVIFQTEYGIVATTVRDLFLKTEAEFKRANYPGTSTNTGHKSAVMTKQTLMLKKVTKSRDIFNRRRVQSSLKEPAIVTEFLTRKYSRTPVFSGCKKIMKTQTCLKDSSVIRIPKLIEISSKIVQHQAERLVGYEKLSTCTLLNLLSKVSVKKLIMIEQHNPRIVEKTNEVWKMKFSRDFMSVVAPEGLSLSWREMYQAAENKRKALMKNIAKSMSSVKASSRSNSIVVEEATKIKSPAIKHKLILDDQGFLAAFNAGEKRDEQTVKSKKRNKRIPVNIRATTSSGNEAKI